MTINKVVLVATAAVLALVPLPAEVVERVYADAFYAFLQPVLTAASNVVPFALIDVLLLSVVGALAALTVRDVIRGGWARAVGRAIGRLVVGAAGAYLLFLLAWGFNYRRVRLVDRLPFDRDAVTADAVARLAAAAVDQLNAGHRAAHAQPALADGVVEPALAGAFDRTVRDLGYARVAVGRPKHTLLDWYFERANVDGMTDPFFLETLVAGGLLPIERPFVVAHEWSHLAGVAHEGEASFVAWLACERGSPLDRYSGWIFLYSELLRAARPRDRAAIAARLADGPREDLRAMRDRVALHMSPPVASAGWRVYDSYLKANRVESGAASYSDVVTLALGVRVKRAE